MGPRVLALVCSLATSCTFAVRGLPLTSTDGSTGSDASVSDGPGNDLGGSCDGCLLGCGGVPMHCLAFAPAGPVQPGDYGQAGLQPLVLSSDTTFNTDDGSITGGLTRAAGAGVQTGISFRQATQGNGATNVGVFGFAMLTIADGVTVSFTGDSAVAFASAGDVSVVGTINAVGLCIAGVGGPGGGRGGATGADGGGPGRGGRGGGTADKASGGGGGGYGHNGGRGGNGSGATSGGTAGPSVGDLTADPLSLQGGSGGGGGGGPNGPTEGMGGGGGGAFQLSVNGQLSVSGVVRAGGCFGGGGGQQAGGGGGGSGGALVLDAIGVSLLPGAILAVNGAGGGGGDQGDPGGSGLLGLTAAIGGAGNNGGSNGGAGGVGGSSVGQNGADTGGGSKNAGGGGGACGRIGFRTASGMIVNQAAVVSPLVTDQNLAGKPLTTFSKARLQ